MVDEKVKKIIEKNKNSVLIVDDDEDILYFLDRTIKREYETVDTASNGEEAVDKFQNNNYDLILLDLVMPKMGGLEVLRKIKGRSPETPVVIFSGCGDWYNKNLCKKYGADGFIEKPAKTQNILHMINNVINNRKKS